MDDGDLVEKCQTEELSMIETAIWRVLEKENQQLAKRGSGIEAAQAGGRELPDAVHDGQRNKALLLGLLHEVRSLRSERKQRGTDLSESVSNYSMQLQSSADRYVTPEQEAVVEKPEHSFKEVVEAAARAAVAAAEAAKSAAASVKENSAAIESLAKSLTGVPSTYMNVHGGSGHLEVSGTSSHVDVEQESGSQASGDPKLVELAKVVRKQNRLTHWLLGFMVVTTAVWRFKALSVVLKLQRKISNPVEAFQDIFSGGKGESPKVQKIPGFQEVATLFQGDPETGKPGLLSGLKHDEGEIPVEHRHDTTFSIKHLFPHHGPDSERA